jgi:hypothetical protein
MEAEMNRWGPRKPPAAGRRRRRIEPEHWILAWFVLVALFSTFLLANDPMATIVQGIFGAICFGMGIMYRRAGEDEDDREGLGSSSPSAGARMDDIDLG